MNEFDLFDEIINELNRIRNINSYFDSFFHERIISNREKTCFWCGKPIMNEFVKTVDGFYHPECYKDSITL